MIADDDDDDDDDDDAKEDWALAALGIAMRCAAVALVPQPVHLFSAPEVVSSPLRIANMVEGWHLWRHGYSPYAAHACRSPPLLIAVGAAMGPAGPLFSTAGDALTARLLLRLRSGENKAAAARAYWLNPVCALACALGSLQPWVFAATLAATSTTATRPVFAGILLATAWYADASTVVVLVAAASPRVSLGFAAGAAVLFGASRLLLGDWGFLYDAYRDYSSSPEVEPGLGVGWYLNVVLFERFVPYFAIVFAAHTFVYAVPVAIRLAETPMLAMHATLAIAGIFKPNPTFSDSALNVALAVAHWGGQRKLDRWTVLAAMIAGLPLATCRVARHLWLVAGTGNANHVYFQTVLYLAAWSWLLCAGLSAAT
ncbi:hypothetical protein CTAYLR_002353 [Chrysophaeum taylorii]|uniref:Uncharacterized protein n=1 Tax=Chrysophaeum taylorii TaxID=2483200 RepID=A0AAD7UI22_9STRA|nr:hypothetical protein CTAYLR_002353 [Chrysophaeum taylorii]